MLKGEVLMKVYSEDAVEYIAKLADGGLRDSLSMLDKCLSFNKDLTLKNVIKALGTVNYQIMFDLTDTVITSDVKKMVKIVEKIHADGKDIKQFIGQYTQFILDVNKFSKGCDFKYMQIPPLPEYEDWLESLEEEDLAVCRKLLEMLVTIGPQIKYSQAVKYDFEANLILLCKEQA